MISKKVMAIIVIILVAGIAVGYYVTTWEGEEKPPPEDHEETLYFNVTGTVTAEDTELPIEGTEMTLLAHVGTSKEFRTSNVTDSNGIYLLRWEYDIPTNYTINVEKTAYDTKTSTVYITEATEYTVNFVLKPSETSVYLEPSEITLNTGDVSVGDRFNVTAMVSNVDDLMVFQVALYYDASVINMTSASFPADYVLAGRLGAPLERYGYFDSWGYGSIGFTCYAGQTPFSGDGKLVVFEFEIIATPPEGGSLTSPLIISPENSPPNPNLTPPRVLYETKLRDPTGLPIAFVGTDGHYEYVG